MSGPSKPDSASFWCVSCSQGSTGPLELLGQVGIWDFPEQNPGTSVDLEKSCAWLMWGKTTSGPRMANIGQGMQRAGPVSGCGHL